MSFRPAKTVGIIGLGAIGSPVAGHIARNGFGVVAFDVDSAAMRAAGPAVQAASTIAELVRQTDLSILTLGKEEDVETVMLSDDGVFANVASDQVVVVVSTLAPESQRRLAATGRSTGICVVDAPVARGERAAVAGAMSCFVGGAREGFEHVEPVLRTFADSIHYLGEAGSGQVGKLANNLIFWACICANLEGLKLGAESGLDPSTLRAALLASNAQNWALMHDAAAQPLRTPEADMLAVLSEAERMHFPLPLCLAVRDIVKSTLTGPGRDR